MNDPMFPEVHLLHDGQGTEEKKKSCSCPASPCGQHLYQFTQAVDGAGIARELHQRLSAIKPDIVFLHSPHLQFSGSSGAGYSGAMAGESDLLSPWLVVHTSE